MNFNYIKYFSIIIIAYICYNYNISELFLEVNEATSNHLIYESNFSDGHGHNTPYGVVMNSEFNNNFDVIRQESLRKDYEKLADEFIICIKKFMENNKNKESEPQLISNNNLKEFLENAKRNFLEINAKDKIKEVEEIQKEIIFIEKMQINSLFFAQREDNEEYICSNDNTSFSGISQSTFQSEKEDLFKPFYNKNQSPIC